MIRTTIIVVLTLAAVGMGAIWILSASGTVHCHFDLGQPPQSLSGVGRDGRARLLLRLHTNLDATRVVTEKRNFQTSFGYRDEVVESPSTSVSGTQKTRDRSVHGPCWSLILLTGVYPAIALARARRKPALRDYHFGTTLRTIIVATLTLVTIGTAGPYLLSFFGYSGCSFNFGKTQQHVSFSFMDGVAAVRLDIYAKPGQSSVGPGWQYPEPGFGYEDYVHNIHYGKRIQRTHTRRAHAPGWAVILLFGIYPVFALVRYRRRPKPGHCTKCGYNLTGNVSGVCPECGTKIESREMSRVGRAHHN